MSEENICIFGDSLTWGAYDKKGGWATRLKNYFMNQEEAKYKLIYNLGIPGDSTKELLERIEHELNAREASTIIIHIGKNDCAYNNENKTWTSANEFEENLNSLLKISKKFTKDIIFIGLGKVIDKKTQPVIYNENTFYSNNKLREYDKILKEFCEKNNLNYISIENLIDKQDLNKDCVHLNSLGHKKIFEKVRDFLKNNN